MPPCPNLGLGCLGVFSLVPEFTGSRSLDKGTRPIDNIQALAQVCLFFLERIIPAVSRHTACVVLSVPLRSV